MPCWKSKMRVSDEKSASSSPSENSPFDYNTVLRVVNPFGKYQFRTAFLLWLATSSAAIGALSFAFTAFRPQYRCRIPQCEAGNATFKNQEGLFPGFVFGIYDNKTFQQPVVQNCDRILPNDEDFVGRPILAEGSQESCESFVGRLSGLSENETETEDCPAEELVFDDSVVNSSFSIYHGFYCSKFSLFNVFNSLYLGGMLVGSFVIGVISDLKGRLTALMVSVVLLSASGIILAFIPQNWLIPFAIFRLTAGNV